MFFLHNNLKLLILFFPIAIITGSFLTDLTVSLIALTFLTLSIFLKLKKYYFNIYSKVFFLWCAYLIFLSLISDNILLSLESSLFYCRFGFFVLAIWFAFENYKSIKKNLAILFTIVYILVISDSYFQYFFGFNFLGFPYSGGRISGIFGDEFILGGYLSRIFPVILALNLISFKDSTFISFLTIILLVVVDVLVYLSGERTAFFYLLMSTLIIIFFIKSMKFYRIITFIISIIIIISISISNTSIKNRMFDRSLEQVTQHGKLNIFSIQHQAYYESAYTIFKDNFLIGVGPKMFREYCKKKKYNFIPEMDQSQNGCSTHPHNTYLQLLAETGFFGTIPIILIFFYSIYYFLKKLYFSFTKKITNHDNNESIITCLVLSILISIWPLVPTGNFFHNWLSAIYYLPIGMLLYYINEKKIVIKYD